MSHPAIFIIDDDEAVRDSLRMLFSALNIACRSFASAAAFLSAYQRDWSGCIVLDVRMPGMSGLAMQGELKQRRIELPVIFLTGHADVPMAVRALKQGAFDFIEKPLEAGVLVPAVKAALEVDAARREGPRHVSGATPAGTSPRALLSGRELEVLDMLLAGKSSRAMAAELEISVKTVEFHRANIREKLGVTSLAELFRLFS